MFYAQSVDFTQKKLTASQPKKVLCRLYYLKRKKSNINHRVVRIKSNCMEIKDLLLIHGLFLLKRAGFNKRAGRNFSRILINKQDLIRASRVEKLTFSLMK